MSILAISARTVPSPPILARTTFRVEYPSTWNTLVATGLKSGERSVTETLTARGSSESLGLIINLPFFFELRECFTLSDAAEGAAAEGAAAAGTA